MNQKIGKCETIIIGAGPAGMACAMELFKAGREFCVVEKDTQVGGLAKTYVIREGDLEFRTDNGPHRFFSKNDYLYSFIGDLLKEHWIQVKRKTRQYINGVFFDYPINFSQVLKNTSFFLLVKIGFDYLWARLRYKVFRKRIHHFYDYAIAHFGYTLAHLNNNIIGYTEKIWGIKTQCLDKDWGIQRVKGLSVTSILRSAFAPKKNAVKSLVDFFYYPEYGTGLIYETIQKRIEEGGCCVQLQTQPTLIKHNGRRIESVTVRDKDGNEGEVVPDYVVESVHINKFLELLSPQPPSYVLEAASQLHYRSQVYLFITLDKESITDDQWLYFNDPAIPFGRVSEMRNFSLKMSPLGKTSLFLEFFCDKGDAIYNMNASQLLDISLPHFESFKFFTRKDVRRVYRFVADYSYPIYEVGYKKWLDILIDYVDQFENLFAVGRPGRFQYTNQDHSLEMGMLAARSIVNGTRYDLRKIGQENEYFEKGIIQEKVTHH